MTVLGRPEPLQGRDLTTTAQNKDEILASSHLVVYGIGLAVCSHAENNRDLGLTVFLQGVYVIYECQEDERLKVIMDRVQIILEPLSLHFVIHVDSFLIFHISMEHETTRLIGDMIQSSRKGEKETCFLWGTEQ